MPSTYGRSHDPALVDSTNARVVSGGGLVALFDAAETTLYRSERGRYVSLGTFAGPADAWAALDAIDSPAQR